MSDRPIKVLVACGSGVATSTVAQEAVKEIAKAADIPIEVHKSTITEVPERQFDVDVVLTTANYRNHLERPYLSVFPLISGVNKEKCEANLVELLKKVRETI